MKILIVFEKLTYGGADKQVSWLAKILSNNHNVTLLTYRPDEREQVLDLKVCYVNMPWETTGHSVKDIICTSIKLKKYINENSFDLVIAYSSPAQLRIAIAKPRIKAKVLFSHRGDPFYRPKVTITQLANEWGFKKADYYVFQTEMARDFYTESIRCRSTIIPNAINKLIRTVQREEPNITNEIVTVARLDNKQKRIDVLISAFKMVSSEFPDLKLKIFGSGPDEHYLRELAEDCPSIIFEGVTHNVTESVQSSKLFVLSSDYEGIPNSLLEAMSLGVPSVATDCSPGAARMLIQNGQTGIIVERSNIDALANGIRTMLKDPEKAEAMGRAGMYVNEAFSNKVISDMWEQVVDRMSGKKNESI